MATPKRRRSWLYFTLLVAGAANAPLFYQLVSPAPEPESVASSAPDVEEATSAPSPSAPPIALMESQLSLNDQPALFLADGAREESTTPPSVPSGSLPSTVGLLGGGGANAGAYGGAGGGAAGSGGRGSPGFAGGGGGSVGTLGASRPGTPAPSSATATSDGGSDIVSKPQPRLFLARDLDTQSSAPRLGNSETDRSPSPANPTGWGGTSPQPQVANQGPDLSHIDIMPDNYLPRLPSDDQHTLPSIPRASPLSPLDPSGSGSTPAGNNTLVPGGIMDVIDSNITAGLNPTETLYQPRTEQLGPAVAEIEKRVADATDQLAATGVGSPSVTQPTGIQPSPLSGESLVSLVNPSQVPEPMTLALLGLGLAGIAAQRRRRIDA